MRKHLRHRGQVPKDTVNKMEMAMQMMQFFYRMYVYDAWVPPSF